MSIENPFESKENIPVTKEQVLEALKTNGKEDSALELLKKWTDQSREEIRNIQNVKEQIQADFAFDIQRLKIYIEAGFLMEARAEITGDEVGSGMLEAPVDDEQIEQLRTLLQEIDDKLSQ